MSNWFSFATDAIQKPVGIVPYGLKCFGEVVTVKR